MSNDFELPSYFEASAASELVPMLKPAVQYCMAWIAQVNYSYFLFYFSFSSSFYFNSEIINLFGFLNGVMN